MTVSGKVTKKVRYWKSSYIIFEAGHFHTIKKDNEEKILVIIKSKIWNKEIHNKELTYKKRYTEICVFTL